MTTPEYLTSGDTIGIIAPARKIAPEEVSFFQQKAHEWGLTVKTGSHLFGSHFQYSGTDRERAEDLQEMINNPEVKAIICARGGYGSLRTLELTDFAPLIRKPRWIAGFSDITVFHSYINRFTGMECLHSMMPLNFAKEFDRESAESLRKALFGKHLKYTFPAHPLNRPGAAEGELVGGNLSILCSLNGTSYFPDVRNRVLFIEDVDEYLYHIDRMMLNLLHSGVFNKIRGLVVGGLTRIRDNEIPFGRSAEEIIAEITARFSFPVCFGFPAGHQAQNKTLIFGRQTHIRVKEGKCSLEFNP
jgi:muramoyltetrapeptide carboxypeptidase